MPVAGNSGSPATTWCDVAATPTCRRDIVGSMPYQAILQCEPCRVIQWIAEQIAPDGGPLCHNQLP
jgi:hypothetical protein